MSIITQQSIKRNRLTIAVLLVIVLLGISTFQRMPRSEDPGFIIRTASVATLFPGASPERVELLVTDKIEKVIKEIPELDFVESESSTGLSFVLVNIKESYKDMRPIWDDLRRKINAIRGLPDGVIGPFVNDDYGDIFGIITTITGEGYSYAELKDIADDVRNELLLIEDAAKVDIYGVQDEQVFVEYDNAKLAELGMTTLQLSQYLGSQNILSSAGSVKSTAGERIALEPTGNFESVEEIRKTLIRLPGGETLYLQDIANISRGYVDPHQSKMYVSGTKCLGLGISLREGGNMIALGRAIDATINRLQTLYPIGIEFETVAYIDKTVARKVDNFVSNLIQAVAIVLFVLMVFLGLRTGLIVASLIPMAIIMALMIMGIFGIGLDQISLAALIIALGMLVDNAIVMSESVMIRMQNGENAVDAATGAAKELLVPLLISSLTTCAAFLPIYLAKSAVGEYTAPLFQVVTITLLSSWLLSLTMVPLLCVYFLKVKPKSAGQSDNPIPSSRFHQWYKALLQSALRRPWLVLLAAVGGLFLALYGLGFVPSIFFPSSDRNLITGEFELPVGTDIETTEATIAALEDYITKELQVNGHRTDGITSWMTWSGGVTPKYVIQYNPGGAGGEKFDMFINTSDYRLNQQIADQITRYCFEHFPDLKAVLQSIENGPPVTNPVEIRIIGKDANRLFEIVDQAKAKLRSIPGTLSISDDWGPKVKKIVVDVDQEKAKRAGMTSQDISVSLQTALDGVVTSQYREQDKVIPIVMRNVSSNRKDLSRLETLNIFAQSTGVTVPLRQVAGINLEWEPSKIKRRNQLKTVTVSCQVQPGVTAAEIEKALFSWADKVSGDWGIGYRHEVGGTAETSDKANASIAEQLPIALFIIVLLLVGQFNSIRKPAIILLTIPLGLIGVTIGLILAKSYMGFITFLGIISLSGIVINNAIVLIDTIQLQEAKGVAKYNAVINACLSRFRPILLTTCTTVLGLIPLWYGGGPMFEPMAITIIFGLLFATILTLVFVPVLYKLCYRVSPVSDG